MRSVGFTLVLLLLLMYVFAILFRQLTAESALEEEFFPSVLTSIHSLLLHGVLLDNLGDFIVKIEAEQGWHVMLIAYGFILAAAITILNMLIGVLCEVIGAVAEVEKEALDVCCMSEKLE